MEELMTAMNTQMKSVSPMVQLWMNWMILCFAASIFFVWKYKVARWALAALILTMPVGLVVFQFTGTVHLLGIAHWLLWAPLLIFFLRPELGKRGASFKSAYGVWLNLLTITIVICLAFDIWDFTQVALGNK